VTSLRELEALDGVETCCSVIDRMVGRGIAPNEAFRQLFAIDPVGVTDEQRDALRLYWELSRRTEAGQAILDRAYAKVKG
jgi:hypothetical protein